MEGHALTNLAGQPMEVDLCYSCQGLWLDRHENLRLSPQAVIELFKALHAHRTDERRPLAHRMGCPRCERPLAQGYDLVRSGRYVTYRCPQQHGRFSTFASFLVEKGFVRHMTHAEVKDLALRVQAIDCSNCGAPVDLRKDAACPHCRTALSLLDPDAVHQALAGYQAAANRQAAAQATPSSSIADTLVALERERSAAQRERSLGHFTRGDDIREMTAGDVLLAGVSLVVGMLSS